MKQAIVFFILTIVFLSSAVDAKPRRRFGDDNPPPTQVVQPTNVPTAVPPPTEYPTAIPLDPGFITETPAPTIGPTATPSATPKITPLVLDTKKTAAPRGLELILGFGLLFAFIYASYRGYTDRVEKKINTFLKKLKR